MSAPMCDAALSSICHRRREYVISVAHFSCHLQLFCRAVFYSHVVCRVRAGVGCLSLHLDQRLTQNIWHANHFETIEIVVRIFKFIITIFCALDISVFFSSSCFCTARPAWNEFNIHLKQKKTRGTCRIKIKNTQRINCTIISAYTAHTMECNVEVICRALCLIFFLYHEQHCPLCMLLRNAEYNSIQMANDKPVLFSVFSYRLYTTA